MQDLWRRTFQLFREHATLWIPTSIAALFTLAVVRLDEAAVRRISRWFMTQHSVLGGDSPSGDLVKAQAHAFLVVIPRGFAKQFLEVLAFVAALAITGMQVGMFLEEQKPEIVPILKSIASRWWVILVFSSKYIVLNGLAVGAMIFTMSGLNPDRFAEVGRVKIALYAFGIIWQGCLAWLLIPAAVRLLQPQKIEGISIERRKIGTIFAVLAAAAGLGLEYATGRAESGMVLASHLESTVVLVINTIVINVPTVLLFIALAVLAMWGANDAAENAEPVLPSEGLPE
jgi:hypothetical protein